MLGEKKVCRGNYLEEGIREQKILGRGNVERGNMLGGENAQRGKY